MRTSSSSSMRLIVFALLTGLALSGCSSSGQPSPGVSTVAPAAPTAASTQETATPAGATVVFVKDGNIQAWDETSGESRTVFNSGDVVRVEVSDDGRRIAFLRRSTAPTSDVDWHEQSALWVVDLSGENSRELVSAESLRGFLGASETESSNIPELTWIPGTNRLLFNGWTYLVQAEGESHAIPRGLVSVDADAGTQQILLPAESSLRFVVSPDGRQVALLSPMSMGFVGVDGSDHRQNVLTFPDVGVPGPLFPTGVWTEDSQAFVVTGSLEEESASGFDFDLLRVPLDGSAASRLAGVAHSHPGSVTFSPDGQSAARIEYTDDVPPEIAGWFISPLEGGAGPLAVPADLEVGYASLHWSPDGQAYTGDLKELCPRASRDSEVCGAPVSLEGAVAALQWIDPERVLLLTREPSVLYFVHLDSAGGMDATTVPIVAWPLEDAVGPGSFAAVEPGQG